jgi:hypothetical protein
MDKNSIINKLLDIVNSTRDSIISIEAGTVDSFTASELFGLRLRLDNQLNDVIMTELATGDCPDT